MENYNEMNIDLLLGQELVKLKGLMDKIRETNENVHNNSSQLDEINQKYDNITTLVKNIESKFSESTNFSNYVDLIDFKTERDEIDGQLGLIKKAQIDLNKKFSEFNYLFSAQTPKLEDSLDEKIGRLVSIDSFEKGISEMEHKIGLTIHDINQFYEKLNIKVTDFESKITEAFKFDDFINLEDFISDRKEIDNELTDIKNNQNNQSKQLTEFESQVKELIPKIEESFDEKISQLVSIGSLDKILSDLEQSIEKKIDDFNEKIEIEKIRNSLDIVIKDVGDIYRLAGEIDKEKISKLEAKTHEEIRKIKNQMNQIELKLELQKDENKQIKNRIANFITFSRFTELETMILDKTSKLNKVEKEINQKYNSLNRKTSLQKKINITFIILIISMFLFNLFALNNGFHFLYIAIKKVIESL